MIAVLAAAQAVMAVPVTPGPELPPVTANYSIVVARAVEQSDPIPIACGAEFCTSWFLGRFDMVQWIAGTPLAAEFQARIEMGSPFNSPPQFAMLVETLSNGTLRVRATAGFHYQTRLACFAPNETAALAPRPESPRLVTAGKSLCVR